MKHGLLGGSYEVNIDEKNRMLVPAELRRALVPERDGTEFFVVVGANAKVWIYPDLYYEELVNQQKSELLPSEEALQFDHLMFSTAFKIEPDKQGRLLIPEKVRSRTSTERAVTVVGARDHIEVWNRADWNEYEIELDKRRPEILLKFRASQQRAT